VQRRSLALEALDDWHDAGGELLSVCLVRLSALALGLPQVRGVAEHLTACMARGIHVTLGLSAGEIVTGYRSNDVIAPVRFEVYIDMSKAILRHGEPADRLIRLPDIKTVLEDRLAFRYFSDAGLKDGCAWRAAGLLSGDCADHSPRLRLITGVSLSGED
jgi:hypothetical protein